jgi:hypothetical protein
VVQFPLPVPVPEEKQTGGTEPAHSEALTPASRQSEAHPPSDDEVAEVKHIAEVIEVKLEDNDQHISMVHLHSYVPHYATTTYLKHPFLQFHPYLLNKMVTLKIKLNYDS